MNTFAEMKENYPIRETIRRLIPDRLRKETPEYDAYICPFHDDRRPSFIVYDSICTCNAGCKVNGREFGDVLDFIKEYYSLQSWRQVQETLTGQLPDPPKRAAREHVKAPRPVKLEWSSIQQLDRNFTLSRPYFLKRGLCPETIVNRHLGAIRNWPNHITINGKEKVFRATRFAIPDIAFGVVRNIELRLDEEDARKTFGAIPQELKDQVRREIEEATKNNVVKREITDDVLLYEFFGGKYVRFPGGVRHNTVFNIERVIRRIKYENEEGWFSPKFPYVLVHEGSLKALVTEDYGDEEFYYPSISAKGAGGLAALPGVQELIIVQDNEPDKPKPDGTKHNAGRTYAMTAVELSGRRLGNGVRIIIPPDDLKAADDVILAGIGHDWFAKNGIDPVRRAR